MARCSIHNSSVWCGDAAGFKDLDRYTVLYMYNPFPEVVLRSVMASIRTSLVQHERRFRIIYRNPIYSAAVIDAGFKRMKEFHHDILPVHLYQADPLGLSGIEAELRRTPFQRLESV
jgi:hypothetical protein